MLGKSLVILVSAVSLATLPGAAGAEGQDDTPQDGKPEDGKLQDGKPQVGIKQDSASQRAESGGDSYGDRNRGGPYGFYSYPRHRSVGRGLDRAQPVTSGGNASHGYDSNYGSAYYGRNYGAPYYGGAYYDRGTYYRERRD